MTRPSHPRPLPNTQRIMQINIHFYQYKCYTDVTLFFGWYNFSFNTFSLFLYRTLLFISPPRCRNKCENIRDYFPFDDISSQNHQSFVFVSKRTNVVIHFFFVYDATTSSYYTQILYKWRWREEPYFYNTNPSYTINLLYLNQNASSAILFVNKRATNVPSSFLRRILRATSKEFLFATFSILNEFSKFALSFVVLVSAACFLFTI